MLPVVHSVPCCKLDGEIVGYVPRKHGTVAVRHFHLCMMDGQPTYVWRNT